MKSRICGIYKIRNNIDNKYYIGSSVNINQRWYNHKRDAANGKIKSPYLYSAMRKYGIENFSIEPLLYCDSQNLMMYEQKLLDIYCGLEECYNVSKYAD